MLQHWSANVEQRCDELSDRQSSMPLNHHEYGIIATAVFLTSTAREKSAMCFHEVMQWVHVCCRRCN